MKIKIFIKTCENCKEIVSLDEKNLKGSFITGLRSGKCSQCNKKIIFPLPKSYERGGKALVILYALWFAYDLVTYGRITTGLFDPFLLIAIITMYALYKSHKAKEGLEIKDGSE